MNKNQGVAMGFLLAAAMLLRPAGTPAPQAGNSAASQPAVAPAAEPLEAREGPWVASCEYWAPVRSTPQEQAPGPDLTGTLGALQIALHTDFGGKSKRPGFACTSDPAGRWGLPDAKDLVSVTAILAILPNPAHTHLALTFDRSLDAILQAAADNGWVNSYHWLPWRSRGAAPRVSDSELDAEPHHDPEREREPGLIVLRQAAKEASFYQAVYLFVVGETPSQGVDGSQLKNALKYEQDLKGQLQGRFRTGTIEGPNKRDRIAIIGPYSSGSAVPMRSALLSLGSSAGWNPAEVEIAGSTGTREAIRQLNFCVPGTIAIHYYSFAYNGDLAEEVFLDHIQQSGYERGRVAFLVEDNSVYGSVFVDEAKQQSPLIVRFPREISLLRNAEEEQHPAAAPSPLAPYLPFSVKDRSAQDGAPIFSHENTPLSQEAQLMTIARQLQRDRIQFVAITATNPLDLIFLAQFLHRATPDTTVVFWDPDLLTVRDLDSAPFVGTIAINPYLMVGLGRPASSAVQKPTRTEPSSTSYAFYNAASFTFWHNGLDLPAHNPKGPILGQYGNPVRRGVKGTNPNPDIEAPPLWAAAIGRDGYYPLGILDPCSDDPVKPPAVSAKLPSFRAGLPEPQNHGCAIAGPVLPKTMLYPSRLWYLIGGAVLLLCLCHILLWMADYWSPLTRDLAVAENDQPRRRSVYVRASSAILFAMALAVACPLLSLRVMVGMNPLSVSLSLGTIGAGLAAVGTAVWRTKEYLGWSGEPLRVAFKGSAWLRPRFHPDQIYARLLENYYFLADRSIWILLGSFTCVWVSICVAGSWRSDFNLRGLAFDYRCLHPASGLSPMPPIVLLLLGWYTWGVLQTRRLRFSSESRPLLPLSTGDPEQPFYAVCDEDLERRSRESGPRLYDYISCLMITRQALHQFPGLGGPKGMWRDVTITFAAVGLFLLAIVLAPVRTVDHLLWVNGSAKLYEILFSALLFPLVTLCLTGTLRMVLIWRRLKTDLLDRLEELPIRSAFARLRGVNWMTMMRRGGPHQQQRDMARSVESMRQLVRVFDRAPLEERQKLKAACDSVSSHFLELQRVAAGETPALPYERDFQRMKKAERGFAEFSRDLLAYILMPHWKSEYRGFVQGKDAVSGVEPDAPAAAGPVPNRILLAEEFVAIRYVALIGAVLGNLRDLVFFLSTSFVLAILAWNSCYFQPKQRFDWYFTGLLALLGLGVIFVFAQMHRNTILSRITDTKANELGWDFYLRVVSFGALPVLTWLASQFPEIGAIVYRFLEPAVPVVK